MWNINGKLRDKRQHDKMTTGPVHGARGYGYEMRDTVTAKYENHLKSFVPTVSVSEINYRTISLWIDEIDATVNGRVRPLSISECII